MTAEDIARDYPYLSSDDQAHALEVVNTINALMTLAMDEKAYPNETMRKNLGPQVAQMRTNMIAMLGHGAA